VRDAGDEVHVHNTRGQRVGAARAFRGSVPQPSHICSQSMIDTSRHQPEYES
jgi:hypothetical protein